MNDHDNRIHQQCWSGKNFYLYSTTSMSFSPLLRVSHFAVILHKRRSWKTNKNPFSNFILFEQIPWSPAGRFEPQLPIAKPCSLVAMHGQDQEMWKGQGCHPAGTALQANLLESRLCYGCVRPSHVSWHSRRNSSLLSLHHSASSQAKHLAHFKEETWDISMHCKYTACSAVRFLRWRERTDRGQV